jgi:hypothetical protein
VPWKKGGEKKRKEEKRHREKKEKCESRGYASASLILGLDFLHHMSFVNV